MSMNHELHNPHELIPARESATVDNLLLGLLADKKLSDWRILPERSESFEDSVYQVKGFVTNVALRESLYEVRLEERTGELPEHFADSPIRIRVGANVDGESVFIEYDLHSDSETLEYKLAQGIYFDLEDDLLEAEMKRKSEAQEILRAEFEADILGL